MVKARKFVLKKRSEGFPKPTDFKLEDEELPPLKENEYLAEAVYFSVDPYMRAYMPRIPLDSTMIGGQVAKIVESKSSKYPVGKYVVGQFGWRTHTIAKEGSGDFMDLPLVVLPDLGDLSPSLGVGVLGMPGNTAYFGFLEVCQPKAGETVVVTGAAGAVGSHVGQIAKIKGCKVIGIAGSDEKGKWLISELGFDHFINYKTQNVEQELKKAAPQGIDCYFDNVGGEISTTIMNQMNTFGRVAVCGAISGYNEKEVTKVGYCTSEWIIKFLGLSTETENVATPQEFASNMHLVIFVSNKSPPNSVSTTENLGGHTVTAVQAVTPPYFSIVFKQLRVEGLHVTRWTNRWMEGINQNLEWIKQGKLKYKETVTVGFENMVNAFIDMLKGGNTGKAIVKVE